MRNYAVLLATVLVCIAITEKRVRGDEPEAAAPAKSLDCALYTKPYKANEHGAFFLPAGLKWKVMPQYVGQSADGKRVVDDRITLVLQHTKRRFWPVIAKMQLDEAEALQKEFSAVIAAKKMAIAKDK